MKKRNNVHIYTSRSSFPLLRFQAHRTTMYLFILHEQHSLTYSKDSRIFRRKTDWKFRIYLEISLDLEEQKELQKQLGYYEYQNKFWT